MRGDVAIPGTGWSMVGRLRLHRSFAGVEDTWRALERTGTCHAFQRFDWLSTWFDEVGAGTEPVIVEVRDTADDVSMLLPLGLEQRGRTRVLTWMGAPISDYRGPLLGPGFDADRCSPEDLWRAVDTVLPAYDAMHLEMQPEWIGEQANPCLLPRAQVHLPAMFMEVADRETALSARRRKDLRRRYRRLSERGDVRYVVASDPLQAEQFTRTMIEQKRRQYHETGHWDLFAHEGFVRFYERIAREHVENGLVHVSALLCDDTIVAVEWNVVEAGTCYGLMPSTAGGEWAQYSPGRLILQHVLDWCAEEGLTYYDFTVGDEPYKAEWCDQSMATYTRMAAGTLRGEWYARPRILNRTLRNQLKANPRAYALAQRVRQAVTGRRAT